MNSATIQREHAQSRHWISAGAFGILRISWTAVRVPALALLVVMEPFVCGFLCVQAVAALGVFVSLMFEFLGKASALPVLADDWTLCWNRSVAGSLLSPAPLSIRALIRYDEQV